MKAAEKLLHHAEAWRQRIQAENDFGYEAEVAKRGGHPMINCSDRQKQMDEDIANIAVALVAETMRMKTILKN